ncbi:MAG: HXXEE domain-containing protein [Gemmatimonadaceae bacterium]|nr:HXXEE domain-containing protein [Gemmatimonadaceae bacterium]
MPRAAPTGDAFLITEQGMPRGTGPRAPVSSRIALRWVPIFTLFELHNLEELLLDMPAWGRQHLPWLRDSRLGVGTMVIAIALLSAVLFLVAWRIRQDDSRTRWLQRLFLGVMLAVFGWHIAISLWAGSLQPGVRTAVLFLPVYAWLLRARPDTGGDTPGR